MVGAYRDLDDHEYGGVDRVTFRHDGITYTVDYLWWDDSAEEIEFGLEECLNPSEFVSLRIGSRTYNEIDNDKPTDEQCESDRDQDQEFEFHDVASNPLVAGRTYRIVLTLRTMSTVPLATAEDGVTTRVYTVVVIRPKNEGALSTDATLRSLSLSGIDFGTFDSDTTSYTAEVANDIAQTTVTPVRNDVEAAHLIKVGGVEDTDGEVALAVWENVITVEVTAEDGETTRTYTVTVTREEASASAPEPDPAPDPEPADTCVQSVEADGTIEGSRDDTYLSEKDAPGGAGDRYARFYTFTLTEATGIVINLSSDVDTYLYVLDGHGKDGDTLHENDNIASGGVNLNSRLSVTLQPGSYTIEATTYKPATSGSFTLTIEGLGQSEGACVKCCGLDRAELADSCRRRSDRLPRTATPLNRTRTDKHPR